MTTPHASTSRDGILARIRSAVADAPPVPGPARAYRDSHTSDNPGAILDLLAENLADYRVRVHRASAAELPLVVGRLLAAHGTRALLVPDGLPGDWLADVPALITRLTDAPPLTARALDAVDTVITGCAVAIAETGTIVLDAGLAQGRRAFTLVPDHHVCVVHAAQVVASVPHGLSRLDPARPQTWISGPSATSDIELDRVEGVHGPRILDVVLVCD
ncbi:LutC/YkgG family protein [Streptomyces sp. CA-106131]|uniref:LutC/YkgG family protein n=1 Tax=Streptomyces sp. CA-106131 TaxID=3240045 RepID=UPI003D942348